MLGIERVTSSVCRCCGEMVYYESFPAYEMQRAMPSYDPYRHDFAFPPTRRHGSFLIKAALVVLASATILAVVVPKYVNAEKLGKELTVKGFLRTIAAVNKEYRSKNKKFADDLDTLAKHGRIEALVESAEKTGYKFAYSGSRHAWSCTADPGLPGTAHFFIDQSGVLRFRADETADGGDAKVE